MLSMILKKCKILKYLHTVLDSDESVHREVNIMLSKFCFQHWEQIEEPMFRNGKVQFNKEKFVHFVQT